MSAETYDEHFIEELFQICQEEGMDILGLTVRWHDVKRWATERLYVKGLHGKCALEL
jgi:hypothetical protein